MGTQPIVISETLNEVLDRNTNNQTEDIIRSIINSSKIVPTSSRRVPQNKLSVAQENALLQKYAPILYFHKDEGSWPSTVEWYLERTKLVSIDNDSVERENVSINDLADVKYQTLTPKYYLKIKDLKIKDVVIKEEATRKGQVNPPSGFRGDIGSLGNISAYGSIKHLESKYVQIRYDFFYPFNGNIFDKDKVSTGLDHIIATSATVTGLYWLVPGLFYLSGLTFALHILAWSSMISLPEAIRLRHYIGDINGLDMHEGDWEHISLLVNLETEKIVAVLYSAHGNEDQWALPKGSGDPFYTQFSTDESGRPKVYVARESHAAYPDLGVHYRLKGFANDLTGNAYSWDTKNNIVNLKECNQSWCKANIIWGSNKKVNPLPQETAIISKDLDGVFEYVSGPTTPRWNSTEEKGEVFLNRLVGNPALSDKANWNQPQYYETIQCADIDGDGRAELIARDANGIVTWKYDPLKSGWIGFRGPNYNDKANWDKPQYYKTIQCADIDGDGRAELIARDANGIVAWKYDPLTLNWNSLARGPNYNDIAGWNQPQYYETIQCADIDGDGRAELIARDANGIVAWKYDPLTLNWNSLARGPNYNDIAGWNQPQYYETIQCADIDGDGRAELVARDANGIVAWKYEPSTGNWNSAPRGPNYNDKANWDKPQYYETIQCADIDGDGRAELIARDANGIVTWKYDPLKSGWIEFRGPNYNDKANWDKPQYYKTIQCADIDGDGRAELIARDANGIVAWKYEPSTGQWVKLNDDPAFSDKGNWDKPQYYKTIQCADIDGDGRAELIARSSIGISTYWWPKIGY